MKKFLLAVALAVLTQAVAAVTPDDGVIEAREAFSLGDRAKLERQLVRVRGHDLEPYVEYWALRARLPDAQVQEVTDFLARHDGSLVAERLRADWLKELGGREEWELFDRFHPELVQPDQEVACHALRSRLRRGDRKALDDARGLWEKLDLPDACEPVLDRLVAERRILADDVWERVRRLMLAKRQGEARRMLEYLPRAQAPSVKLLDVAAEKPQKYLKKIFPKQSLSRASRELAMLAVARMARADPEEAAAYWRRIQSRFSAPQRAYVYGQLGWWGAYAHLPEAGAWFDKAGRAELSDAQHEWKVRAALRAGNWKRVQKAIEAMPEKLAADPAWIYWLGRAHDAQGRRDKARRLYLGIAGLANFYGNLASEELGQPVALPPTAPAPSADELKTVADNPGLRRALALYRLDMRFEAVREWNWTLRGMDDRALIAAAQIARDAQIFDRSIIAADKTRDLHDYSLRFPAPFLELVEPKARELALDHAWIYGLMRQESRFVLNARSSAGASGLMQIMPATAKWVARKLGLKDFHVARMNDMDMNVTLGTNYLRMVLEDLDHHPVLASAAYNAGPRRARRWRGARPLEGAIYAETIPFSETRDYVKKVMSNAIYYSALFDGKPQSLKERLGVVAPQGASAAEEDLP